MDESLKRCTRCKEIKPLEDFHRDKNRADGRGHRCRACDSAEALRQHAERKKLIPTPPAETKTCSKCGETKPLNQFHYSPRYALGVTRQCKACRNEYIRLHHQAKKTAPKIECTSKTCLRCGEEKTIDSFARDQRSKDRHTARCLKCRRETDYGSLVPLDRRERCVQNYLRSLYGLSFEAFQEMFEQQRHECAICEAEMKKPQVDHCHITGRVRALLCRRCNNGLGYVERDPGFMAKALAYLDKYK